MGLFYTNVILYKAQQRPVANFLRKQGRTAYVSPIQDDFIVVYGKETEDQEPEVLKRLSEALSKKFKCAALASLVHDSDIYLYWLYSNGKLLNSYNSLPGYFGSDAGGAIPEGGDAKKLCMVFDKTSAISKVQKVFELVEQSNVDEHPDEYLSGEDIHDALVQALGMPSFGASTGYYTIENAELPKGSSRDNLATTRN